MSAVEQVVADTEGRRVRAWESFGISRRLAVAVARDVEADADYDPEADMRVRWCRAVVVSARRGEGGEVDEDLRTAMLAARGKLPGLNWKDLAAGEGLERR